MIDGIQATLDIATDTQVAFQEAARMTDEAVSLIRTIAEASNRQASGIEQIAESVKEMERTVTEK